MDASNGLFRFMLKILRIFDILTRYHVPCIMGHQLRRSFCMILDVFRVQFGECLVPMVVKRWTPEKVLNMDAER